MTTYPMPAANPVVRAGLAVAGSAHPRVELTASTLSVRMGAGFRADVPRSSIRSAAPETLRVGSRGAHGWRGRWLVNTSGMGLVRLTIDPPARGKVLGVPVRLRELILSLEDPDTFRQDLRVPAG